MEQVKNDLGLFLDKLAVDKIKNWVSQISDLGKNHSDDIGAYAKNQAAIILSLTQNSKLAGSVGRMAQAGSAYPPKDLEDLLRAFVKAYLTASKGIVEADSVGSGVKNIFQLEQAIIKSIDLALAVKIYTDSLSLVGTKMGEADKKLENEIMELLSEKLPGVGMLFPKMPIEGEEDMPPSLVDIMKSNGALYQLAVLVGVADAIKEGIEKLAENAKTALTKDLAVALNKSLNKFNMSLGTGGVKSVDK